MTTMRGGRIASAAMFLVCLATAAFGAAGDLDPTFDGDGRVTTSIGEGEDGASDVAVQPDGKILVTGEFFVSGEHYFGAIRYESTGALEPITRRRRPARGV